MKPGDLIEWVYQYNSQPVDENAQLWSTSMQRYIPIGVQPAVLISITDEFYTWLTQKGLLHVHVDDAKAPVRYRITSLVVPRVVG
jgi:hypothetical protein